MMGGHLMNVIETRKLTKFFGKNAALQGLDLTVRQGEFMALSVPMGQAKPLQYVSF
jgi:ABC-2 type transport system ATP-binding protein